MLTWINEKAKWIIVIFAAGIAVGLLAMDRVPNQGKSYPVGEVNDSKITYAEFDARIKMIVQNQYQGQHLEDEQYNQLRSEVFRSFVRQILLNGEFEKAELQASVAELESEFTRNPDAVRGRLVQEAQRRLYAIQQQATSQEDLMQRSQAYIASLPKFLTDSTFNKDEYDAWLKTPEAFKWGVMLQYEEDLKTNTIPVRQLQALVGASFHATSLEANWTVGRRMTDYELQVAVASASDFAVDENTVDSVMVAGYFNAHKDSFFVMKDMAQFQYAYLPVEATAGDDARIREYAMTLYYQLTDSSSTTTFEDMARISSEDPGTAEKGGILSDDYVGRGVYVKEFEDKAFALDSGAISEPVKTRFGYHIIKSYGKSKDSTGADLVKVGHILLVVNASSETIDSLENVLAQVKASVDAGKSFEEAAKDQNLMVQKSNWISRGDNIDGVGYLKGLAAYAWPNEILPEESSKVSPVMKNNKWVAVAIKTADLKAGERSLDLFFNDIKATLLRNKAASAAEAYLNSVADKVKAFNADDSTTKIEKVRVETKSASVDGYVPGFGYGNVNFAKAVKNAKEGEWTAAMATDIGAVMLKVTSKKTPEEEALKSAVKSDVQNASSYGAASLFNEFVNNLEAATPVKNNLDLYYRD
ncbi:MULTISPECIES: peptidylprolyl isomerase [unclassified Fibrobacter]|uniref:peptidylprolyl isomerase n=1 Tax=unclassified Fibrobacter TaxID=2634177 RepID=UPI00091D7587|nr:MULTISPECIES: peptidylprolyl isomerase [unclassified Fibrobacter]OWV05294.1 peptidylprolyl isomerase [Fibrobacter sp. UWH3]OWV12121.1 peptidylprolyl isomerase [Fibrobacter sp. UWH1]SHL29800.1 peptidyl-prolyl cis-trans isomerase D [Fibrobacter sp. UWH6]